MYYGNKNRTTTADAHRGLKISLRLLIPPTAQMTRAAKATLAASVLITSVVVYGVHWLQEREHQVRRPARQSRANPHPFWRRPCIWASSATTSVEGRSYSSDSKSSRKAPGSAPCTKPSNQSRQSQTRTTPPDQTRPRRPSCSCHATPSTSLQSSWTGIDARRDSVPTSVGHALLHRSLVVTPGRQAESSRVCPLRVHQNRTVYFPREQLPILPPPIFAVST